ncbi:TetR/AcrR family transcriptional regulator [Pseudonocardia xinjiangensis]|uniref:TetR/AcrR family transcriptional regulator n=1 Tax=Pseudonocardia xinjiangensis TaxID=75289 RepID=UPI003D89EFC1
MVERKRLTASDWTAAALDALGRGGLAAVAVEPLAARLGTTKGSFYWHFSNRDALLEAALLRWERVHTEEIIALVDTDPDPHNRLRYLMTMTLAPATVDRPGHSVLLALQANASHPLVAPIFARVTQRRLGYITGLFTASGFPPEEARRRSLLAYTAYLGHTNLADASPELVPVGAEQRDYVDAVVATLTRR